MANTYAPARVDDTPENREFSARIIEHETRLALEQGGSKDAIGWYDHLIAATRRVAALVHPELATSDEAWLAFTYILAVTSNGHTVEQNVRNTFAVYGKYNLKTHQMPIMGFGIVHKNMKDSFRKWNNGIASVGVAGFRDFLLAKKTVREVKELNPGVKELMGDTVYGSTIIGSKIGGGFFANMNGRFDALTMDRWFMRTWGRIIGHLAEMTNIRTEIKGRNGNPSTYTVHRGMALIDDPHNGGNRHYIRATMQMALDRLQADYPGLTMADMQAILWYEEKDLYTQHNVNSEEPTDYAIEAAKYAKQNGLEETAVDRAVTGDESGKSAGRNSGNDRLREVGRPPQGETQSAARDTRGAEGEVAGGRSAQFSPKQESARSYGQGRDGAVSVTGVHYSLAQRAALDSRYYGTGIKGAEAGRIRNVPDSLYNRTYFYINEGQGVHPESGLGRHAHSVNLRNVYDTDADPLKLAAKANGDGNKFEASVQAAGFDGYYVRAAMGRQGAAVLIGNHSVAPEYHGTNYDAREMTPPEAPTYSATEQLAREIANSKLLPSGQMTGADWKKILGERAPAGIEAGKLYYKSDVASITRAGVQFSPKEKARALGFDTRHVWYRYDTEDYQEIRGNPGGDHLGAMHFAANPENAEKRFEDIRANDTSLDRGDVKGFTGQYWLKTEKTLKLRDMGTWNPESVVRQLLHQYPGDPITHSVAFERAEELADEWASNYVTEVAAQEEGVDENPATEERIAANKAIIAALKEFGYDSIKYRNTFEGGTGIMVFDPSQVRSINAKFDDGDSGHIMASPKGFQSLYRDKVSQLAAAEREGDTRLKQRITQEPMPVSETPAALQEMQKKDGSKPLKKSEYIIGTVASVIQKGRNEHSNSEHHAAIPHDILERLPVLLADPLAVFDRRSKSAVDGEYNTGVLVFTKAMVEGEHVVVAITPDATYGHDSVNKILSVHTRSPAKMELYRAEGSQLKSSGFVQRSPKLSAQELETVAVGNSRQKVLDSLSLEHKALLDNAAAAWTKEVALDPYESPRKIGGVSAAATRAGNAFTNAAGHPYSPLIAFMQRTGRFERYDELAAQNKTAVAGLGTIPGATAANANVPGAEPDVNMSPKSPAFKKWFGDSKVVDAEGKPLAVYHGTSADIYTFKDFSPLNESARVGFYFTADADYADLFAEGRGANIIKSYFFAGSGARITWRCKRRPPVTAPARRLFKSRKS